MKITIESIPNGSQRYPTVGDWIFEENGDLNIKVSETGDYRATVLVGLHEMIEAVLCKEHGIEEVQVSAFDMGDGAESDEPGAEDAAPYHNEHSSAEGIERLVCALMGLKWGEYEHKLEELY